MEALYRELGDELLPGTRTRWPDGGKRTRRNAGRERPEPGDYGLDPATLRREFAFYDERFAR